MLSGGSARGSALPRRRAHDPASATASALAGSWMSAAIVHAPHKGGLAAACRRAVHARLDAIVWRAQARTRCSERLPKLRGRWPTEDFKTDLTNTELSGRPTSCRTRRKWFGTDVEGAPLGRQTDGATSGSVPAAAAQIVSLDPWGRVVWKEFKGKYKEGCDAARRSARLPLWHYSRSAHRV